MEIEQFYISRLKDVSLPNISRRGLKVFLEGGESDLKNCIKWMMFRPRLNRRLEVKERPGALCGCLVPQPTQPQGRPNTSSTITIGKTLISYNLGLITAVLDFARKFPELIRLSFFPLGTTLGHLNSLHSCLGTCYSLLSSALGTLHYCFRNGSHQIHCYCFQTQNLQKDQIPHHVLMGQTTSSFLPQPLR
ncbi:hypothetical protein LguiB_006105 [Lonicera macranthoides]